MKPKFSLYFLLCGVYALFLSGGILLFSEAEGLRSTQELVAGFARFKVLEGFIHGQSAAVAENEALLRVDQITGPGALLVRNFSSMVFRPARRGDLLKGRNVLFTREGVRAKLWIETHKSWVYLEPNTLLVVEERADSTNLESGLVLSFLSGGWKLEASPVRGPASQLPQLNIRNLTQTRAPPLQVPAPPKDGFLAEQMGGESQTLSDMALGQDTFALSELLEAPGVLASPLVTKEQAVERQLVPIAPALSRDSSREKNRGSLDHLSSAIEAESRFIARALKLSKKDRRPSSLDHADLAIALEEMTIDSSASAPQLTAELAQVLDASFEFFLVKGRCSEARDLVYNVLRHYPSQRDTDVWKEQKLNKGLQAGCNFELSSY